MKRMFIILTYLIISLIFVRCYNETPPKPLILNTATNSSTNTSTSSGDTVIVVTQSGTVNSFTLENGSKNSYTTSVAGEKKVVKSGKNYYVLYVGGTSSGNDVEFWFNSKPTSGTYSVDALYNTTTMGVNSGKVGIYVKALGTEYFSEGLGIVTVSTNGNNYTITMDNEVLVFDKNGNNDKILSCTSTIP